MNRVANGHGAAVVPVAATESRQRTSIGVSLSDALITALLVVGAALVMMPFVWMFSTSLRNAAESFSLPPQWLPREIHSENYQTVLSGLPLVQFMLNSVKIAALITLGQLATCSLAAFAFARLRFPGRDVLFIILLSSLMVPIQVTIIPIFIIVRILGLLDLHESLIIPSLVSAFGVFLLRQFFLTIPTELEDAARIDGAGFFTIFRRIFLPLAGPGLSALAIFTFNFHWNEFFRPLLFLSTWERMTLPLGLTIMRGYMGTGNVAAIMAGLSLAIIPILIIFVLAQRYLIEGITLTGLKG
jgi:multiple sugar transport system permease protein